MTSWEGSLKLDVDERESTLISNEGGQERAAVQRALSESQAALRRIPEQRAYTRMIIDQFREAMQLYADLRGDR